MDEQKDQHEIEMTRIADAQVAKVRLPAAPTAPTSSIADLGQHVGAEVTLRGWLYNKRGKGKLTFLIVRDGSGLAQAVAYKPDLPEEVWAATEQASDETSIIVRGLVKEDSRAVGGYELAVKDFQIVQQAADYPISAKKHSVAFLMDERHLWLRSRRQRALLRVRATVEWAIQDFLNGQGYTRVDSPIITPTAAEGSGNLFTVDYFGAPAYLAQTGQLYIEAAMMSLGKVYSFGPTFRAEKSKTRRHLAEFWMVEPEAAYMEFDQLLELEENFVSYVVQTTLDKCEAELDALVQVAKLDEDAAQAERLEQHFAVLRNVKAPFPRLAYDEAIKVLQAAGNPAIWGDDIGGDEETILASQYDRPVFVTRYPASIKAFYMQPDPDRPELALAADLLAPEGYGEIIGGSQRIHDFDLLLQRMAEHKLPREAYEWYLDLRRYGSVPHSGFGMGLERCVAWITQAPHLRETIPFPRMMERMYP